MSNLKDCIRLGSWNLGGANDIDDPEFIDIISEFDIVILGETFKGDDTLFIPGFKGKNVFRNKKHKNAKRFSGGISVFTKLEICNFVTPVRVTDLA